MRSRISSTVMKPRNLSLPVFVKVDMAFGIKYHRPAITAAAYAASFSVSATGAVSGGSFNIFRKRFIAGDSTRPAL